MSTLLVMVQKGKSQLKLVEIEKANRAWGSRGDCYVTFQALDTKSKETDTYQTEIDFSFLGDKIDVFLFRKKSQKKGRETGIVCTVNRIGRNYTQLFIHQLAFLN